MTISASILAHSRPPKGPDLITFETYGPRALLHEDFLMHRALSRNASTFLDVPVKALIDQVRADPAMPSTWGEMTVEQADTLTKNWLMARDEMIKRVGFLTKQNPSAPKRIAKALLRPWEMVRVVATGTQWDNFFALSRHRQDNPEMRELADAMWRELQVSEPRSLKPGEWHLPYVQQFERDAADAAAADKREEAWGNLIKVSVARCSRTSVKNHRDRMATFMEDVVLYESTVPGGMEHQATPDTFRVVFAGGKAKRTWEHPELHGNFVGWCQHRKTLPSDTITTYIGD